jgi:hypothetical protein
MAPTLTLTQQTPSHTVLKELLARRRPGHSLDAPPR